MARRFHVKHLQPGTVSLDAVQSRHARDALRLTAGVTVELFDDAGSVASGLIQSTDGAVVVHVEQVNAPTSTKLQLTVAAAVPKANRADWMVEKLAEIGADTFIPLATARSVVLPGGRGKLDRWERLSAEASKQSGRAGVMTIGPLTDVTELLKSVPADALAWCLATETGSVPINVATERLSASSSGALTLFIGPEGGWTPAELAAFTGGGVTLVRMTANILRIETAALAATGIVRSLVG